MKTMTLKPLKPRNPLVAAGRFRKAGLHRPGAGALRSEARMALRREIEHLPPRRP
jgi:hypothetical protein